MIYDVETILIINYFLLYYKVVTTLSQGYHNAFYNLVKIRTLIPIKIFKIVMRSAKSAIYLYIGEKAPSRFWS